ncbi:MAG: HEAT repeat domain-containing protein [Xanthomonadaceae bacterium]|nr:HEAT repeat domain-containing protein [Xanthomonadaceae bacterium]
MLILLFFSLAFAQTHSEIRESINFTLSERHPTDSKESWLAMGVDTPSVIIEMIEAGEESYRRVRLLEALGYFQGTQVSDFLRKEAKRTKNHQYRLSAVKGLLRAEGERGVEFAKEYLQDEDVEVRIAVARALKSLDSTRADQVVADYLETEQTPWVKRKIQGEKSKTQMSGLKLKPSGSNEGKPELEVLGKWEGYTFVWNSKKKELTPKKAWIEFDLGLGNQFVLKWKIEGDKKFIEAKIEKQKWKWAWSEIPEQPKLLEFSSEPLKMRLWVVKTL